MSKSEQLGMFFQQPIQNRTEKLSSFRSYVSNVVLDSRQEYTRANKVCAWLAEQIELNADQVMQLKAEHSLLTSLLDKLQIKMKKFEQQINSDIKTKSHM